MRAADFRRATFSGEAHFEAAKFLKRVNFSQATFSARVLFRETKFREDDKHLPGPTFSLAHFEKPELVLFYQTYLGQALFQNCDVSKFQFSSVRWRERRANKKRMVFEQGIDTEDAATVLRTPDQDPNNRNYDLIAELYQQLKKNYDDKRDYWTAGDFHYGEMEMKRLSCPRRHPALRWLHRNLGLVAWYKYASEYGEGYGRPVQWLAGLLFLFMLLYPILGLHPATKVGGARGSVQDFLSRDASAAELSYHNYIHYGSLQPGGEKLGFPALLGHSLMTSVGVAALQRDLAYEPAYPWGRALSWLELLLTSTLIALFLLAVRRQFRR